MAKNKNILNDEETYNDNAFTLLHDLMVEKLVEESKIDEHYIASSYIRKKEEKKQTMKIIINFDFSIDPETFRKNNKKIKVEDVKNYLHDLIINDRGGLVVDDEEVRFLFQVV
tara:strand:- start:50 stop:388 length:339 start_codon:yes stop_codon:yes gene_type:complete